MRQVKPTTDLGARLRVDLTAMERNHNQFPDMFESNSCPPREYKISVDTTVLPVVYLTQQDPMALRVKFKTEQDSPIDQDIITSVTKPTTCVNSFVCTMKANGFIRLCLNFRDMNKTVLRPHFMTPTFEDVISRLDGEKWFTIVDVNYWQLKLTINLRN